MRSSLRFFSPKYTIHFYCVWIFDWWIPTILNRTNHLIIVFKGSVQKHMNIKVAEEKIQETVQAKVQDQKAWKQKLVK